MNYKVSELARFQLGNMWLQEALWEICDVDRTCVCLCLYTHVDLRQNLDLSHVKCKLYTFDQVFCSDVVMQSL